MSEIVALDGATGPTLVQNITHFARALRKAGLPIGTDRVLNAIRAVEAAGFSRRGDFFLTLQACFVSRPEHLTLFAQSFALFWRDPQFLERLMLSHGPQGSVTGGSDAGDQAGQKRAAEALLALPEETADETTQRTIDAALTASREKSLRHKDFEQMSLAEIADAKRALAAIKLPLPPLTSRRTVSRANGPLVDWRGTMQGALRSGGEMHKLARRARRQSPPNLVVLCDISGSMSGYSRLLLHFLHAASNARGAGWAKVHAFAFGTQLTNITRALARRDVDEALALAGRAAADWEGGTSIGQSLYQFNRDWSRRVLGQGAVVLLITDGLERGDTAQLAQEAARLRRSARKLIWLNPLLRWDGFTARAGGIRALLPHVDSFRAAHSIASLEELAAAMNAPADRGEKARLLNE